MTSEARESRILRLGLELLSSYGEREQSALSSEWWDERILEWVMERPSLKVQLFRFIDALPALRRDAVYPALVEYLGAASAELPAPLRFGVRARPDTPALRRAIARAARANVERVARRFIAGVSADEAMRVIQKLRERRLGATVDVLGERVITEAEAAEHFDRYLAMLARMAADASLLPADSQADHDAYGSPLPRANISVKLSGLTSLFEPADPEGTFAAVAPRLRAILDLARRVHGFVWVDMEHYEYRELTTLVFERVLEEEPYRCYPWVGLAQQAYLRDCETGLSRLATWAARRKQPVWVRLVKGAYWDYETVLARQRGWPVPVFEEKWQTDANFERCVDVALATGGALRLAIGSHNIRSIAAALAAAEELGLPARSLEFQVLYGMAQPLETALVRMGQRCRVYVPCGEYIPGMAYLVRRLLENTSNESFLRRSAMLGREAPEQLLESPMPSGGDTMKTASGTGSTPVHAEQPASSPNVEAHGFTNEPLADFSRDDARQSFRQALQRVRQSLPRHAPLIIDGQDVDTVEQIVSHDPSEVALEVGRSAAATADHVDAAVSAATQALPAWRALSASERASILERAADLLSDERFELAALVCFEAGKPWREADADIAEAIDFCRYYAELARSLLPYGTNVPGETNVTEYLPRGIAGVISPWNFPVAILLGMTAGALVTGNAVLMKPAEQTPICALRLFDLLREAGVPPGVLHYLPGRGEVTGARIVEHPEVATIAFTGSRTVGQLIALRAIETSHAQAGLKRVIAEMGGKNAIIVDHDADLDQAVPGILASAFGYGGQKCSACSRVIVHRSVYEAFVARSVDAARALAVGPAQDPRTSVGPLIDDEAVARVRDAIEEGKRVARLALEVDVGPLRARGHFVGPVIFADVPEACSLAQEEVFGPVLAVLAARDLDDAIRIANATPYALTGGIYSRGPRSIAKARSELLVGNLYINRGITGALVARQPFGGFRASGVGYKAGGRDYLLQHLVARTVTENTLRQGFAPES